MAFYAAWLDQEFSAPATQQRSSVNVASPRDPILAEWFGGGRVAAGVTVNQRSVEAIPAALRCVAVLAQTVAGLPLHLLRKDADGKIHRVDDHPLSRLFRDGPSGDMDGYQFRELGGVHLCLRGNFYALIDIAGDGRVMLKPLNPDYVRVRENRALGRVYQVMSEGGSWEMYSPDEIFHVQGLGTDGLVGLNPIQAHRQSFGLTIAQEEFGSAFFGNGTHLNQVFVKKDGELSEEAYNRLAQELTIKRAGLKEAHRALILEEGLEPSNVGMTAKDAQFLEARQFQVPEVCRIFGVPPHKVYDLTRATFSNIEEQSREFVQDSILPWAHRWENRLNKTLLTQQERAQGYYWKHSFEGLLRANSAARSSFYQQGIQSGWLMRNEARRLEDLNPIEGLDEPLVPLNMQQGTEPPEEPNNNDD